MTDFLLQATLSNLLVSTLLAGTAWLVQRRFQAASLANLLWVIVLVKMITPPLFSIPLLEVESVSRARHANVVDGDIIDAPTFSSLNVTPDGRLDESGATSLLAEETTAGDSLLKRAFVLTLKCLCLVWFIGSAALLVVSTARILRFHLVLCRHLHSGTARLNKVARQLSVQMGLKRTPSVAISRANVSPFVWWSGLQPQIVIPERAVARLGKADIQSILAHEMAHIKRRDHWVRWLEWTTLVTLWWNPIMWWAHRQLRVTEEIACDALAIETISHERHDYAGSLLNMAELLTTPAIRPPVVASALTSGGTMEKRLTMIIAGKNSNVPNWLRAVVTVAAILVFPIGWVQAQDYEAVERRLGGAVEAGELSLEQANVMMEALRRSTRNESDDDRVMEAKKRRYMEFVERMEAAVKGGEISEEEAEKKLIAVRIEMFGGERERSESRGEEDREMEAKKRRYMEIAERMEAAVEAGKISAEDAEEKLIDLRTEMFRSGREEERRSDDERSREAEVRERLMDLRNRYVELERALKEAVEAEQISAEDAEERLRDLRKRMSDQRESSADQDREMESRRRKMIEVAREIEAAVDAGLMSKADAEEKLISLRRELFGK